MNLAISNIAWSEESDNAVFSQMSELDFTGLEIAPTRIFPENPYDDLCLANDWKNSIYSKYGFEIPSMQSIWYGRTEKLFGTEEERNALISYTKKAVLFAETIGCKNLVFGCPRNRVIPESGDIETAVSFFKETGDYAHEHHTVIALEANPPIYNTNFINRTGEALELIEKVDSDGFMLNLDLGTMIENREEVSIISDKINLINHVHVSEPGLLPIKERDIHCQLAELLKRNGYTGFVSIEVKKQDNIKSLVDMMKYVKRIFD